MSVELSGSENAAVGGCAGAVEVTMMQSLNYLKNAKQQGLPFTMNPLVLYRGYLANLSNMCTGTVLQFAAAGALQRAVAGGEARPLLPMEQISTAMGAGMISASVVGPLELVMIQQQRKGGSAFAAIRSVVSPGGSFGMRGIMCTAMREGIYTAGYLGIAPVVRVQLMQSFPTILIRFLWVKKICLVLLIEESFLKLK